ILGTTTDHAAAQRIYDNRPTVSAPPSYGPNPSTTTRHVPSETPATVGESETGRHRARPLLLPVTDMLSPGKAEHGAGAHGSAARCALHVSWAIAQQAGAVAGATTAT